MSNNIKVAIKVRPLIAREKRQKVEEQWTVTENSIVSLNPLYTTAYHFDHVFGKDSSNRDVFDIIAHPIVKQSLEGFNGTIFAYGQTSSGKTHTMLGNDDDPGITALAVRQLFEENESDRTFMIRVGYIEIYNEKVFDLLSENKLVTINQNGENDIKLTNKEVVVKDGEAILNILKHGNKLRKAAQTNMNEASSRSHAIFRIIIESEDSNDNGPVRVSYLNLVDLAGSEKANDAGTSGTRMKEGNDINKSLLHLGIAIRALSEGKKFVDVRSSKLTRILQASLGGNANTAIVCNITPAAIEETASTLGFANQAKTVKNEAKCNEVSSPEGALMKQMQAELKRLKAELVQSNEKLRAEIAFKESTFLSGRSMRVAKVDRRKTWHHMPGDNCQPLSMIPRCQDIAPGKRPTSLLETHPQIHLPDTPRELRFQPTDTPSPKQAKLKYHLGRMEKEFADLQQFTALETHFDLHGDAADKDGYIEKLEKDLRIARDEVEKYRTLSYEKMANGSSNSNGMNESLSNGEKATDTSVMINELQAEKDKNNEIMRQIAELQAAHANEMQNFQQKLKAAEHARERAEILQAEGEITFAQYKKQTNQRINELISEVETLKMNLGSKPERSVDLNISKMPIKVEPANSYELTELKFELDHLKLDQDRNKKIIESLEAKLKSITAERDRLKSQNSETSGRNNEIIKESESKLKAITAERDLLRSQNSDTSGRNNEIIKELESRLQAMAEEMNILKSGQSELSVRHNTIVQDLKSQLEILQSEKSEVSECHDKIVEDLESQLKSFMEKNKQLESANDSKNLELQVKTLTEALNAQQSEHSELSARHNKTIKDLESQLQTMTAERNFLQSNVSELQCDGNAIKDLELQIQILAEEKNVLQSELAAITSSSLTVQSQLAVMTEEKNALQLEHSDMSTQIMDYIEELDETKSKLDSLRTRFDDLQKIYDNNLEVIEKTEEECRTFKASLLESYDKIKISMEEAESLKTKNSSLSLEVSNLKNSLNTQSGGMDDLRKKVRELEQQNSMLSSEVGNELVDQIEELKNKHREDISGMEEFYKKLTEQLNADSLKLQTELELQKELLTATTNALQISSDKFKADKETLEANVHDKQQQIVELENTIAKLQSELSDKEQHSSGLSGDLRTLQNELQEKQQQLDNYEATISKHTSESSEMSSELKAELQEKQQVIDNHEAIVADLKESLQQKFNTELSALKAELQDKQQAIDNHETVVSDLKSSLRETFQTELSALKVELQERHLLERKQIIDDHEGVVADLKESLQQKFNTELSALKAELHKNQQAIDNHETIVSDIKSSLRETFQTELSALKVELQERHLLERKQIIDNHEADVADLKETLQQKFHTELSVLKAELQEKCQLIDNHAAVVSDLKSSLQQNFQSELLESKAQLQKKQQLVDKYGAELLEMKADLQLKKQEIDKHDQKIANLQSELNEKDRNVLSAKDVIASLENKLKSHEPEEQKKASPKRPNAQADRKARRYSQHDESRLWMDDTIAPPKSIHTQTDPSDESCACQSMNNKIIELKQQVAIKTAVVNTQRLEMENHPLISENKNLKRELDDKEAEIQLLNQDVDHYRTKLQREQKSRECPCLTKTFASKEVQVNCDREVGQQTAAVEQNGLSNGQLVADGQHGVSNGYLESANGQNGQLAGDQQQVDEFDNLSRNMKIYYASILPRKYRNDLDKLEALEKVNKELTKKSNFYKEICLSRRADIKKLEAKLAGNAAVSESGSPTDAMPE